MTEHQEDMVLQDEEIIDGGGLEMVAGTVPSIVVGSGIMLTLRNITMRGTGGATTDYLVKVEAGGHLILEEGVVIRDHSTPDASGTGGGVYVAPGGRFEMNGGTISGNSTNGGTGGGVFVASGGRFEMKGGTIGGNSAINGGGVYVADGGRFEMEGGTIGGNSAINGGGVYVADGGTFEKTGGTIYGGTEPDLPGGTVVANSANGGGSTNGDAVYYAADSGYYRDGTLGPTDGISTDPLKLPGAFRKVISRK
jgi:hypothetical protein